jgi:hypothetical protein
VNVFDVWLKKVDDILDECLTKEEVDITITEVDGIPLNKYASLKLKNMVEVEEENDVKTT